MNGRPDPPKPIRSPLDGELATRSRIRKIIEDVAGADLTGVLLFGSRARGDAEPDSDWDIAVLVRERAETISISKRLAVALGTDQLLWDDIIQPIVLRPSDMQAAWSLVVNLEAEGVAL